MFRLDTFKIKYPSPDVQLRNKFDTLRKDKSRLHEKKKGYFDVREDLIKTGAQLVMRRKQLIAELAHIYPIHEVSPSQASDAQVGPGLSEITDKSMSCDFMEMTHRSLMCYSACLNRNSPQ